MIFDCLKQITEVLLMRRFWIQSFLILTFVCFLTAGCQKEVVEDGKNEITFIIKEKEVLSYRAKVVMTHNGTNRDKYCGFVIDGHDVDVTSHISKGNLYDGETFDQKKRVIDIKNLSPNMKYTYVVAGVDEDNRFTGDYGKIEFMTKDEFVLCDLNENWSVEYKGQALNGNGYYSHVKVRVSGMGDEQYIFLIFSKEERQRFDSEDKFLVYATEKYDRQYNDSNNDEFWVENTKVYNQSMSFYRYLKEGEYVAYVIGVDGKGFPTGRYNKTEYFAETEYPMTEGYANLLGTWKLTDADGNSFNVIISKDTVNRTLILKRWGGQSKSFYINYNQATSVITFKNQLVDSLARVTLNNETVMGKVFLKGWYVYNGVRDYCNSTIAVGNINEYGEYMVEADFYVYNTSGVIECDKGLSYVFYYNNDTYLIKGTTFLLPITMKKM